jgi:translin
LKRLDDIIERVTADLETKNSIRDLTLKRSRELIRFCANSIRAVHRGEAAEAADLLARADAAAAEMVKDLASHPDIYHTGYTQDALKELVEAHVTKALVFNEPIPTPHELRVEPAAYLNGLGEAATELRRFVLDVIRHGDVMRGEAALDAMDAIYGHLVCIDFPDAVTGGLRRTTDAVRAVLERTRGDFTTAVRQDKLREALSDFEAKLPPG